MPYPLTDIAIRKELVKFAMHPLDKNLAPKIMDRFGELDCPVERVLVDYERATVRVEFTDGRSCMISEEKISSD